MAKGSGELILAVLASAAALLTLAFELKQQLSVHGAAKPMMLKRA
jgi:hypothetical protein